MLMKRISKMRQKKGAVLFAVIAVMTLLIAMASTAYYTARSAYNSVVSNYNYSQLYLSAISVSDMVAEAVTNDSIAAATGAGVNNFKDLRDIILNEMETSAVDNPSAPSKIVLYSNGIAESDAMDLSNKQESILNSIANSGDSLVAGMLDGVVVEITLLNNKDQYDYPIPLDSVHMLYWFEYKFSFKTTAFYRDNVITVEDIVTTVKTRIKTNYSGSPGGGGTPGTPGIPGTPTNNNVTFDTFFTATGQEIGANNVTGAPDINRASRIVKISTHEISDDAFFQNNYTFFTNGNDNKFVGGITSTGSVFLDKFTTQINGDGNDWYIGEDLVMLGSNGNKIDLTNGGQYENNLYVGNDLVLSADGPNITATDIYVEGDLYILGQATINGNLHVNGNVYYEMPDGVYDEDGNKIGDSALKIAEDKGYPAKYNKYDSDNEWTINGELDVNGTINRPEGVTGDAEIKINGTTVNIPTGSDANVSPSIGSFDPEDIKVEVTNRVPDTAADKYVDQTNEYTVQQAIQNQAGSNKEYNNYTSKGSAYETTIDVDLSLMEPVYVDDAIDHYEYSDPSTGLVIKTEDGNQQSPVTVGLPYDPDGYVLNLKNVTGMGNAPITYEVETGDEPVQIVLAGNIDVKDENGQVTGKGFSWKGDRYDSNDYSVQVVAKGDGNVVFEMANMKKDDSSDTPVQYDPTHYGDYETVQYVAGRKEVVGNEAQVAYIGTDGNLNDKASGMLQTGTSTPKAGYDNQFVLVSNANGTTAVDAKRQGNAFCGYVYAPNGVYDNNCGDGAAPVFGGMIVSTYTSNLAKLYYAEPKPSAINEMLGSMISSTPGGNAGGTPAIPPVPEVPATDPIPDPDGDGTWEDPQPTDKWFVAGSNYVG